MINKSITGLLAAALTFAGTLAQGALTTYTENFEGLNAADSAALSGSGWKVFGNVFGLDWSYWYGYGVFPAPNGTPGFSSVATGQGGASQGSQQLVVYSDYNNTDHPFAYIEANVFQEFTVGVENVGQTWRFQFDAKMGDLVAPSTALAFIKTLNPSAGFATTNFLTLNTTGIASAWGTYSIDIDIGAPLAGQILQIGFSNVATNYASSGVFYDNVSLTQVPEPATFALLGGLLALGMVVYRRRK